MTERVVDYSKVLLEENIPLDKNDLLYIEEQRKGFKVIPIILAGSTLFTMAIICWIIRDSFKSFTYVEYLLLAGATLALYIFCYFICWIVMRYDSNNWRKDITSGKCKLTSVVIGKDKTEHGEYLTFAGKHKKDSIRIQVTEKDYKQFQIGTKIILVYLKFSKEALNIIELENE